MNSSSSQPFSQSSKYTHKSPAKTATFNATNAQRTTATSRVFPFKFSKRKKRRRRRRCKVGAQLVEASSFSQAKTMSQAHETSHCLITHAKSRKNQCPLPSSSSSQTQLQEHGEVFLVILVTILQKYYCC